MRANYFQRYNGLEAMQRITSDIVSKGLKEMGIPIVYCNREQIVNYIFLNKIFSATLFLRIAIVANVFR